jgi:hypothetical protein
VPRAATSHRSSLNERIQSALWRGRLPARSPLAHTDALQRSQHYEVDAASARGVVVHTAQNALDRVHAHSLSRDQHVPIDVVVDDSNERASAIVALLTALTNQYTVNIARLALTGLKNW